MKSIIYIILYYIILLIIGFGYTFYNVNKKSSDDFLKKIEFNVKNQKDLKMFFKKKIIERLELLYSGKMNYKEWLQYGRDNPIITYEGSKYYYFIYEKVPNINESDIARVQADKNLNNLEMNDIINRQKEDLSFTKYSTNRDLIDTFYYMTDDKNFDKLSYFWVDPITNIPSKKTSWFIRYSVPTKDKSINISGIIGVGMELESLESLSKFYYFNEIGIKYIIFICFIILIIGLVFNIFKNPKGILRYKSYFYITFLFIYFIHYLNNYEYIGTTKTENSKYEQISTGILSISFLVGINIYILTILKDKSSNKQSTTINIFIETALVFSISIMLVLFSLFRQTNNKKIEDVSQKRLSKQLFFNLSVYINIIIILNYIIFIFSYYIK